MNEKLHPSDVVALSFNDKIQRTAHPLRAMIRMLQVLGHERRPHFASTAGTEGVKIKGSIDEFLNFHSRGAWGEMGSLENFRGPHELGQLVDFWRSRVHSQADFNGPQGLAMASLIAALVCKTPYLLCPRPLENLASEARPMVLRCLKWQAVNNQRVVVLTGEDMELCRHILTREVCLQENGLYLVSPVDTHDTPHLGLSKQSA